MSLLLLMVPRLRKESSEIIEIVFPDKFRIHLVFILNEFLKVGTLERY